MPVADGFKDRIAALIDAAPSQKKLAWLGGVSGGTLINWRRGLGYRESDVRDFCARTRVSMDWLRDGVGNAEVEKFKVADEDRYTAYSNTAPAQDDPAEWSNPRNALRIARQGAGLTIGDLAKKIGKEFSYIDGLENGTTPISENTAELLAKALPGLSKQVLLSGSDAPRVIGEGGVEATYGAKVAVKSPPGVTSGNVPIIQLAQAGTWGGYHEDTAYEYGTVYATGINDRRAFAIEVTGDSMVDPNATGEEAQQNLYPGEMVICSPATDAHDGDAAVVATKDGQAMIKYWFREGNFAVLKSRNPNFSDYRVPIESITRVVPIVGKTNKGKFKMSKH